MVISVSPGALDKNGQYLKDKDSKPKLEMLPVTIKTIDNKAVAIQPK